MNNTNRISAQLTDGQIDEIIAGIQALQAKLGFLVRLSAQDRRELAKMGEKSIGFDENGLEAQESLGMRYVSR